MSKEEIPGEVRTVCMATDLLQALKGEPLSSVFSTDWTLISASVAPHCGEKVEKEDKDLMQPRSSENRKEAVGRLTTRQGGLSRIKGDKRVSCRPTGPGLKIPGQSAATSVCQ